MKSIDHVRAYALHMKLCYRIAAGAWALLSYVLLAVHLSPWNAHAPAYLPAVFIGVSLLAALPAIYFRRCLGAARESLARA